MTDKKNSEGLEFILKLDVSANDEKKLVQLAKEAICDDTHDKRTFLERKNRDLHCNPYSINIGSIIATAHAMVNNDFSTKDKLYMVMQKYINLAQQNNPKISKEKALENFQHDFATAFPKEYGISKAPEKLNTLQIDAIRRARDIVH